MVTNITAFCTFIWLHSQFKYKTELQSCAGIHLLHDSPIPFHISFQACNDRISWGLITWNSTCISGHSFLIFSALKTLLSTKYLSYAPTFATDKIFLLLHKCLEVSKPKQRSCLLCKLEVSHLKLQSYPQMETRLSPLWHKKDHSKEAVFSASCTAS